MVASAHPASTQAGLDVLKDGGNAFDAAVAVASTLNVVEPFMSGVGGIGVALLYIAGEKRTRVLNFSGRAASGATPNQYDEQTKQIGAKAPLVPGNVAGWLTWHEKYGKLPRKRLFRDAIDIAANGVPLTPFSSEMLALNWSLLTAFDSTRESFLSGAEKPAPAGALFRQPDLARSLSEIAENGRAVFYEGRLARSIVESFSKLGGLLTREDLASYMAEWEEPLSTSYRGYEVRVPPPNSSGFQIIETLNILEGYENLEYGAEDTLHVLIEAVKLAVEDRLDYGGDPAMAGIPIERLLSKQYAASLRKQINLRTARAQKPQRYPREHLAAGDGLPSEWPPFEVGSAFAMASGDATRSRWQDGNDWWRHGLTTHFAVVDQEGNAVTVTQTLGNGYGCGLVAEGTGIFLNNMCLWFDIDPKVPSANLIAPRKRVDFCVSPVQIFLQDRLSFSIGTPGSYGILQTTVQMICNVLDFGMNVQEAIEAPRFRLQEPGLMNFEGRFPQKLVDALNARGHTITRLPQGWSRVVGGAHGIQVTDHETLLGGADPRRDGLALGF
jgi:gamma-glutamyltranspeptidase/glutathione hydrolase